MSAGAHSSAPHYFVPDPSKWPLVGSIAMLFTMFGAVGVVNDMPAGKWSLFVGLAILFYMMVGWFGQVAGESEGGKYNRLVDSSFRWSMSWFIFSEVMFFAAFFGALYYARAITTPWLGDLDHKQFLWPDFGAAWPSLGPAGTIDAFQTIGPWQSGQSARGGSQSSPSPLLMGHLGLTQRVPISFPSASPLKYGVRRP